jgi:DNA replication and repair protein RecF
MFIKDIALYNFRNYEEAFVEFSSGINIMGGMNGQGKTNLLEAVAFLSTGKAFRTRKDADVIMFDRDEASIRATTCSDGTCDLIEARLYAKEKRKQIFINGVRQKNAALLPGKLGTVLFCPEDLYLARDGSSIRRSFLDRAIEQLRPRYGGALREYNRLLEHKTRILRDWKEKPSLLDMLDDFSLRMVHYGAVIVSYRAAYVEKLNPVAARIHGEISGGTEELELKYRTVSNIDNPNLTAEELRPLLEEHYFMRKQSEIDSRSCLSGPHKDDLEIKLSGRAIKDFGSQGQVRTAVLSMKLAERDMYKNDTGTCPVMLLDDVLSELDAVRQNYILNRIEDGQVIITCCTDPEAIRSVRGKMFRISQGCVYERRDEDVSASWTG